MKHLRNDLALCLWLGLTVLPLYSQSEKTNLEFTRQELFAWESRLWGSTKCGFSIVAELRAMRDKDPKAAALLKLKAFRPSLQHSYLTPEGLFRIHYDTTGNNAVNPFSTIQAGVPDYVFEAGLAAQRSYSLLVDTLGMRPHTSDNGDDGPEDPGPEFDFYIINQPSSRYGETFINDDKSSYTTLDNDYSTYFSKGLNGLRVTVAHEYFHAVQTSYIFRREDIFFFEISSSWFEDFAYDEVNDYFGYLRSWFRNITLPLNTKDNFHEYGSALWLHYLTKRLGTPEIVRRLWERIAQEPAVFAMKNVLQSNPYNLPFNQALQEFYSWCFFTNHRADEERYFAEGADYPAIKLDRPPTLEQNETISGNSSPLSAQYSAFLRNAQEVQAHLQIQVDPGRFGLTLFASDENDEYLARTGYGLAPVFASAQARQDTIVFLVVNNGLTADEYELKITLGNQIKLENLLEAPYPNPFRSHTAGILTVPYRLSETSAVEAAIFSDDGRRVWNKKPERKTIGAGTMEWNGRDEEGRLVPSGVYIMRFWAGAFAASTKIVVINR